MKRRNCSGLVISRYGTGFYEWLKQKFNAQKIGKRGIELPQSTRNIEVNEQGSYVEGNQTIIYGNNEQDVPKRKILFCFYETDGDHCWAFPVLKIYDDKTFVLDVLVYDSNADTGAASALSNK